MLRFEAPRFCGGGRNVVKERSRFVAAILIVGDEPILLETWADPLIGWQISTSASEGVVQSIRSTQPDLLIFCHSIPDERADGLIDFACELNPNVRALGICRQGQTRDLNAERCEACLDDLGRLRTGVARLLQSSISEQNVTQSDAQNSQTTFSGILLGFYHRLVPRTFRVLAR
jgi:hypothetical protein